MRRAAPAGPLDHPGHRRLHQHHPGDRSPSGGPDPSDSTPPRWREPLPVPRLPRATGLTGTGLTEITAITSTLTPGLADTVFVDRLLNTERQRLPLPHRLLPDQPGQLTRRRRHRSRPPAPRLTINPGLRQLELVWATNTPWSNDNQEHRVYRSRRGQNTPLELIARVPVQTQPYRYIDTGTNTNYVAGVRSLSLSIDSSYCYRVETIGRYTSTTLVRGLLSNYSQIVCASPADTTRPCPPQLGLDSLNCATADLKSLCQQSSFANTLRWSNPARDSRGQLCDPTVVAYNIYYGRYGNDPLTAIGSSPTTTFRHENLTTVAGCYYVTAVNRRGVESGPSNKVCNDICPLFVLPNVFTPNHDGRNDVFTPQSCGLFVRSVETTIYNRWGGKVYETVDPLINWNGSASGGQVLPSALYYYEVRVVFDGLDPTPPP